MNNLLKWPNLDSIELRILLHEFIGGTGQSDDLSRAKPRNFYLPLAGPSCRVALKFKGKKVIRIRRLFILNEDCYIRRLKRDALHIPRATPSIGLSNFPRLSSYLVRPVPINLLHDPLCPSDRIGYGADRSRNLRLTAVVRASLLLECWPQPRPSNSEKARRT